MGGYASRDESRVPVDDSVRSIAFVFPHLCYSNMLFASGKSASIMSIYHEYEFSIYLSTYDEGYEL